MLLETEHVKAFKQKLLKLDREELLDIIDEQNPSSPGRIGWKKEIMRHDWVFRNKMSHLNDNNGSPYVERDYTKEQLVRLIDIPFEFSKELMEQGFDENVQRQIHVASDPVLWARQFLNIEPRTYQALFMRDIHNKIVLRLGRRMGKSWALIMYMLWYAFVHPKARILVLGPLKSHVNILYEGCLDVLEDAPIVKECLERHVRTPQAELVFSNNSTIRFFSTGMTNESKSDSARGQEADLIILDEMDYMGPETLNALLAMFRDTDPNKLFKKKMIGASTPTGQRKAYWQWNVDPNLDFQAYYYPSYCFIAGTNVTLADGTYMSIEDIRVGDQVMTEKGPRKVTKTYCHQYEGDLYTIVPQFGTPMVATPEHPFYSRDYGIAPDNWIQAQYLRKGSMLHYYGGKHPGQLVQIEDIWVTPSWGNVYNLEVEDTHTYLAEDFLVHNCDPQWTMETEKEMRAQYRSEQAYKHEVEADWGEDADGVYPRKYVDIAFCKVKPWDYKAYTPNPNKHMYLMGVDWDKYGAGVNIVIVRANKQAPFDNPVRVIYRDEIRKGEFTYLESVEEILKLDRRFNCEHIYLDQGSGESQVELLRKYGLDNPNSGVHRKVKAIHFASTLDVRDPYTRQIEKKRIKPFMVENLVHFLEAQKIEFNKSDDELYLQLISYIKIRDTSGYPVFEAGGNTVDHAHDGLILAMLAVAQNYDPMLNDHMVFAPRAFSNETFDLSETSASKDDDEKANSRKLAAPQGANMRVSNRSGRRGSHRPNSIKRSSF